MEMTTKTTTSNTPNLCGLYAITPCSSIQSLTTSELLDRAQQVLQGGARILQYREKQHASAIKIEQAQLLKAMCVEYGALFLINDDIELARAIEADGVHLGQDDVSLQEARSRLGDQAIIGISCYNQLELAKRAEQQGANYVAFGRFFPSSSKPNAVQAEISLLEQAKSELSIPVACIGGITLDNAKLLVSAGADMLAVIESVFGVNGGADNRVEAAREFTQLFSS